MNPHVKRVMALLDKLDALRYCSECFNVVLAEIRLELAKIG